MSDELDRLARKHGWDGEHNLFAWLDATLRERRSQLDVDSLTLRDVRAVAERAEAVLTQLRGVQNLLGGAAGASQPAQTQPQAPVVPPTRTRTPMSDADIADMKAQREALVQRNRDVLPDEIKRAEGIQ